MTWTEGSRVGPFEIHSLLGVGGMGEVYRARDTRLGRDVAIKILSARFTGDADRLARLEREARMLASLSHPTIAAIYGIEEIEGVRALVLELVEGETIDQRLRRRGAFTAPDALAIARQVAEALDAAHERGVVHRDLKPANVTVTPSGDVKLLDFGIAKTLLDADAGSAASQASTVIGTEFGVILGTAAYMSPEQARGQPVDKRTDVWAFGCVLYEMLTGRPPFTGDTPSDTLARILGAEPDWAALPATTPHGAVHLLTRCLEKDAKRRLRGLGGIELALDVAPTWVGSRPQTHRIAWVLGAGVLALTIAALVSVRWLTEAPPEILPVRFEVPLVSIEIPESGAFALSPDGRRLVFLGTGADGVRRLWDRSLDSIETRPISGTEGEVGTNTTIFWSPDSRFIGFYSDGAVKRVDRNGGVAQVVCRVPAVSLGGTWNREGLIVVGTSGGGLVQCPASGGTPTAVTTVDASSPYTLDAFPSFLPDGRHVLYLRVSRTNPAENGLYIADTHLPPAEQGTTRLVETGFSGEFVPESADAGRILFVRDRTLWAVPFAVDRLALAGEPAEVASPIGTFRDWASFDAQKDVLVFRGGVPHFQLTWRNRTGAIVGRAGEPSPYVRAALSPDATLAAVLRENRLNRTDQDLWLVDLLRNTTTRFTSSSLPESIPAWSADGKSLIFALGFEFSDIWVKPLDGSPARTLVPRQAIGESLVNPLHATMSASPDGRFLVFTVETRAATRSDIWIAPLEGEGGPAPLLQQEFDQVQPSISPGGHWLAYVSNESGVDEVFVRPLTIDTRTGLPVAGAASLISRGGGRAPRWRADGEELFFQSSNARVMAARALPRSIDGPVEIFQAAGALPEWGVSPDGQRFLLAMPAGQTAREPFSVVLNWQEELKQRVPTR